MCLPLPSPSAPRPPRRRPAGPRQPAGPVAGHRFAGVVRQCAHGAARAVDARLDLAHRIPVGLTLLWLGPAAEVGGAGGAGRGAAGSGAALRCPACRASNSRMPLTACHRPAPAPPAAVCAWAARLPPARASCRCPSSPSSPPCCGAGLEPPSCCPPARAGSRRCLDVARVQPLLLPRCACLAAQRAAAAPRRPPCIKSIHLSISSHPISSNE